MRALGSRTCRMRSAKAGSDLRSHRTPVVARSQAETYRNQNVSHVKLNPARQHAACISNQPIRQQRGVRQEATTAGSHLPGRSHATQSALQRVQLAIHHNSSLMRATTVFPHSSLSPPFHHEPRVQPLPDVCSGPRGDQATENARGPRHGWKNASIVEN
ncbi:hypothetical protein C8Q74DRAFT_153547 [Fomes fomentarius]|nr:hypothetical protein C8Q74DRAFT_153547 [Fomes fomentarius]